MKAEMTDTDFYVAPERHVRSGQSSYNLMRLFQI
jgi:hypothetical protein